MSISAALKHAGLITKMCNEDDVQLDTIKIDTDSLLVHIHISINK